jgi:hypothetical protein
LTRSGLILAYFVPHAASASALSSVLMKVCGNSRSISGFACVSCYLRSGSESMLGLTVIAVSFFESVV